MKKLLFVFAVLFCTGFVSAQTSAHLDSQKVLDTMPSRKKALKEIEELRDSYAEELQADEQEYYTAASNFEQYGDTLSPIMRQREQRRLMKMQQDYAQKEQEYSQDLQYQQNAYMTPILERLQKAVDNVAERQKIDYVLDVTYLLHAGGTDITNLVIVEVLKLEAADNATPPAPIEPGQ